jgi:hypothetical protein
MAAVLAPVMLGGLAQATEAPQSMDSAQIRLALEKLNVLGRVLYIAAHPDDENTRLIAYWANGALYDAAYLSLTRGDGGQNLIGPELRDQLGVIRTQELLAARRIDHGRQFWFFQIAGGNFAHLGPGQNSCGCRLGDPRIST